MKTIRLLMILIAPLTLFSQKNNFVQSLNDFKITFIGNWAIDTTRVSFLPGATTTFDPGMDVLKGIPSNTYDPFVSTVCNSQDLEYNALPLSPTVTDISIRVTVGVTGKYVLQVDSGAVNTPGVCMMLEDLAISYTQDLKANSSYSFVLSDTTSAPRFILHIGQAASKTAFAPSCSYKQNGMAIITPGGSGPWNCTWQDSLGNTLVSNTNITGADSLKNLAPGMYPVTISGNSGYCYMTYNDTIIIDPTAPISVNALITNVNCSGINNGKINANTILGGQSPFSYNWSNSSNNSTIQNLSAGVYILTVTDANGCNDTSMYAVQLLSNLSVNFTASADTLTMANPTLTFSNQTGGQTNLSWSFGDGSPSSNNYNASHTYSVAGTFTVELTANDANCTDTKQKTVVVLNPTGINSINLNESVKIYGADGFGIVRFNLAKNDEAVINVYSIEGKLMTTKKVQAYSNTETVSLGGANGIYLVKVQIGETELVKKIIN